MNDELKADLKARALRMLDTAEQFRAAAERGGLTAHEWTKSVRDLTVAAAILLDKASQ